MSSYTLFRGTSRIASGTLADIACAAHAEHDGPLLAFDDLTGRTVDLDLRGSAADVAARHADAPHEGRPRGRPKLGVVGREVTLLPRHWDWLQAQPGGASVALRKLIDAARREEGDAPRRRAARDAAYAFLSTMAGDMPRFEEAARALFAGDRQRFTEMMAGWPEDVAAHAMAIAYSDNPA